jgi:uncharacterized membrane protein YeiB
VIGLGHEVLLFSGDIIDAYGFLGLLLAGIVASGTDQRLLGLAIVGGIPGSDRGVRRHGARLP